jgi:drug/metabolite transporter (DMT)-like permease
MLYGTIFDLGFALVTAGPPVLPTAWQFWAGTAYLAIIGSVVTFPLHYNLVREIGAGRTAYNGIVTVCVAMLLSTLFEGFNWDALSAGGMALALAGMGLALRARQKK